MFREYLIGSNLWKIIFLKKIYYSCGFREIIQDQIVE